LIAPLVVSCSPSGGGGTEDAGADAQPVCGVGFLGDATQGIDMKVIALGASGTSSEIHDGSDVALILPPQGGRVIFIGVRANNIDPCAVKLSGALRDLTNDQVRVDIRSVNLVPDSTGYGASTDAVIATFSNIPVCPNQWSVTNTFGNPYQLEVTLTDHAGRTAQQKMKVVPRCAQPDNEGQCMCLCKAGYVLGENCGLDGGAE
jgi:hypothetical protein